MPPMKVPTTGTTEPTAAPAAAPASAPPAPPAPLPIASPFLDCASSADMSNASKSLSAPIAPETASYAPKPTPTPAPPRPLATPPAPLSKLPPADLAPFIRLPTLSLPAAKSSLPFIIAPVANAPEKNPGPESDSSLPPPPPLPPPFLSNAITLSPCTFVIPGS